MAKEIPTGTLAGFPELTPREQVAFNRMKDTVREVYERFGFAPIETPAVERTEVLLAKEDGETSKQVYRLDHGDGDMALRFDHTVPLARYVAEHGRDLAFPFRRYAIGRVYRGERSQKGRFREFYQADVDVVGDGSLGLGADADVLAVVSTAFDALEIGEVVIRLSNRKVLAGLAESLELGGKSAEIFRVVDRLEKVGEEAVRDSLAELGCSAADVDSILRVVSVKGEPAACVAELRDIGVPSAKFAEGVQEIETVATLALELGVPASRLVVDLAIARGLDYYTGTVYETTLAGHPELGSVCSGGRYDDLAGAFSSRSYPGVGVSIGLSRLFAQLRELELVNLDAATPTRALVVPLLADLRVPLAVAASLRAAEIPTEVYLEDKKAKAKFAYADKQGIPVAVVIGEEEVEKGICLVKLLSTGEQREVPLSDVAEAVAAALAGN